MYMNRQIRYVHGETGIELILIVDTNNSGDIELKKVYHKGENILPILGEDITVDIEMFCENCLIDEL